MLDESKDPSAQVHLDQARFERDLAREAQARLNRELKRLERRLAESESDRAALSTRLGERERYLGAIHASLAWKATQWVRGLFGRRW